MFPSGLGGQRPGRCLHSSEHRLVPLAIVKTLNARVSGMMDYGLTLSPELPHKLRSRVCTRADRQDSGEKGETLRSARFSQVYLDQCFGPEQDLAGRADGHLQCRLVVWLERWVGAKRMRLSVAMYFDSSEFDLPGPGADHG